MAREYPWRTTAWRRTRKRKPGSFSMIHFKKLMAPKREIHQMPLKKSFDFQAGDKKEIIITSGDISPQYLVVSVEKNVSTPHIWC